MKIDHTLMGVYKQRKRGYTKGTVSVDLEEGDITPKSLIKTTIVNEGTTYEIIRPIHRLAGVNNLTPRGVLERISRFDNCPAGIPDTPRLQ